MSLLMNLEGVSFINCQRKSHLSAVVIEKGLELWNVNFTGKTMLEAKGHYRTFLISCSNQDLSSKDGSRRKQHTQTMSALHETHEDAITKAQRITVETFFWFILLNSCVSVSPLHPCVLLYTHKSVLW